MSFSKKFRDKNNKHKTADKDFIIKMNRGCSFVKIYEYKNYD